MIASTLHSLSPSTAAALDDSHPDKPKRRPAARCLFGRADPDVTKKWLRDRLNELQQEQNQRWNFDFVNDCPLALADRFVFTPMAESDVPAFYRSKSIGMRRRKSSTAEENQAPVIAPECSTASSTSSLLPTTDALESAAGRLGNATATPALVKRQSKITAHLNVRKRRAQQRLPKMNEDNTPRRSPSPSSSHSDVSDVGQKRARVDASASSSSVSSDLEAI